VYGGWVFILRPSTLNLLSKMEVVGKDILEDYLDDKGRLESNTGRRKKPVTKGNSYLGGIERAKPKIHEYRERYKSRRLRPSDLMTYAKPRRVVKQFDPSKMDPNIASRAGYDPWFGEGTTIDF